MYHKIRGLDNSMKHSMTENQMTQDHSLKFWICHVQSLSLGPNNFQTLYYMSIFFTGSHKTKWWNINRLLLSGQQLRSFGAIVYVWGISRCGCYRSQRIYQDVHVPDCKHDIYILHVPCISAIIQLYSASLYGETKDSTTCI